VGGGHSYRRWSVKKLLFYNLSILYLKNPDLFDRRAWPAFERDILPQDDAEKFARDEWFAAIVAMDRFDGCPACDPLGFDGFQAMRDHG